MNNNSLTLRGAVFMKKAIGIINVLAIVVSMFLFSVPVSAADVDFTIPNWYASSDYGEAPNYTLDGSAGFNVTFQLIADAPRADFYVNGVYQRFITAAPGYYTQTFTSIITSNGQSVPVQPNTTYNVSIEYSNINYKHMSETRSVTTLTKVAVTASAGNSSYTIFWPKSASTGCVAIIKNGQFVEHFYDYSMSSPSYTFTNLTPNTAYEFQVFFYGSPCKTSGIISYNIKPTADIEVRNVFADTFLANEYTRYGVDMIGITPANNTTRKVTLGTEFDISFDVYNNSGDTIPPGTKISFYSYIGGGCYPMWFNDDSYITTTYALSPGSFEHFWFSSKWKLGYANGVGGSTVSSQFVGIYLNTAGPYTINDSNSANNNATLTFYLK
jgi:hypothetical protein